MRLVDLCSQTELPQPPPTRGADDSWTRMMAWSTATLAALADGSSPVFRGQTGA